MRALAIKVNEESFQRSNDKQWMSEIALESCASLYPFHNGSVVAESGVEREVTTIGSAEPDRGDVVSIKRVNNVLHGFHRIIGHTESAGKHVGRPAGQNSQCGIGAGHTRGHLVEGAIAAVGHHHIDATTSRVFGETSGVTPSVGLHHLHIMVLGQALVHRDGVFRRH